MGTFILLRVPFRTIDVSLILPSIAHDDARSVHIFRRWVPRPWCWTSPSETRQIFANISIQQNTSDTPNRMRKSPTRKHPHKDVHSTTYIHIHIFLLLPLSSHSPHVYFPSATNHVIHMPVNERVLVAWVSATIYPGPHSYTYIHTIHMPVMFGVYTTRPMGTMTCRHMPTTVSYNKLLHKLWGYIICKYGPHSVLQSPWDI